MPSWSWMAYSGGIKFLSKMGQLMVPPFWDLDFAKDGKALIAKVRQFKDCQIRQEGGQFAIFGVPPFAETSKVGSLWFDFEKRIEFQYCVVVGMEAEPQKSDHLKTYYILVVRERQGGKGYERLGAGTVEARYVSTHGERGILW